MAGLQCVFVWQRVYTKHKRVGSWRQVDKLQACMEVKEQFLT